MVVVEIMVVLVQYLGVAPSLVQLKQLRTTPKKKRNEITKLINT